MRITRIETAVSPENMVVVVRVGTDTGLEGLGQTAPRHADITAAVLHALVAPIFLSQNPWDHRQLVDRCLRTHYPNNQPKAQVLQPWDEGVPHPAFRR